MLHVRLLFAAVLALSTACVQPTNPYDPDTPSDLQKRAVVKGSVRLTDLSVGADVSGELGALRVTLLEGDGDVAKDSSEKDRTTPLTATDDSAGTFIFPELVPGTYRLRVENVGNRYNAPALGEFVLLPGQTKNVGELEFRYVPPNIEDGPGTIEGDVELDGVVAGPRTVRLFKLAGGVPVELTSVETNPNGHFSFTRLSVGSYAVVGTLSGFTPDYKVDVEVGEGGGAQLEHSFQSADALTLYPVTAVLLPAVPDVEGTVYVSGDVLPLSVLAFGGVTGMRLSTNPAFLDADDAPLEFDDYSASASVALPDAQGPITVFAQFEARSPGGFAFQSDAFSVTVVRDTTPPEVVSVTSLAASTVDADGNRYATVDGELPLDIDARDEHSAIREVYVEQPADNAEPNTDAVAFSLVFSNGGLVHIPELVALSPGDGEKVAYVFVKDRAGNLSAAGELRVLVDTTPPALPLSVTSDVGGQLTAHTASVAFDETGVAVIDLPVSMQLSQGATPTGPFVPYTSAALLPVVGVHDEIVSFSARLVDRAGNTSDVIASEQVQLSLVSSLAGSVVVDGVPSLVPDHAGVNVKILDGAGATVVETTTSATGAFSFAQVPEGSGLHLFASKSGSLDTDVLLPALVANGALTLPPVPLPLARGDLAGTFLFADRLADATAHGGIVVAARLSGGRATTLTTLTAADGSFSLLGVPVTLAGETWEVSGQAADYSRATSAPVTVTLGQTTTVAPLQLTPVTGDFDLCAPGGACNPLAFSNLDALKVRLRSTVGVTDIRVAVGAPPSGSFAPFDAGTDVLVDVSAQPDGTVAVFVQTIQDGAQGPVLRTDIVRDTVPPTVAAFERTAAPQALDARFTNATSVTAELAGDPGVGLTAPLAPARFAFADTPPAAPPVDAVACPSGVACVVPLPGAPAPEERAHTLYAFACDAAGNCSAPEEDVVIYDATPPSALHGVAFAPLATGGVVQVAGEFFTRTGAYSVQLDVGSAQDANGDPALDENGDAIRDVFAYRFSLVEAIDDVNLLTLATDPAPDGSEIVEGLPLPPSDAQYTVFALFVDAAGNATLVEPNPFHFDITLDTAPPQVSFALDGGATTSRDSVVALTVTPGAVDPPIAVTLATNGTFAGATGPFALPLAAPNDVITLAPAGDGPRSVFARFVDAAGNIAERSASIVVDGTAPAVTSAVCSSCTKTNGITYTTSATRQVTIDVGAEDASGSVPTLQIGVNGGARVSFPNTGVLVTTLANADGPQTVELAAHDAAGNVSGVTTLNITLDRVAPTVTAVIDGQEGAATANVAIGATDANGVVGMRVSTGAFSGPVLPFSSPVNVALPGGARTVNVEVTDAAGKTATTTTTLPLLAMTVDGGATTTNKATLPIVLTVPAGVQFLVDDTLLACATATGYAAAGGTTVNTTTGITAPEGPKTISACIKDAAGNTTLRTQTITLDTTGPQGGFMFIDANATVSLDRDVVLNIGAPSDATQMASGEGTINCATASYGAVSTTANLTLAVGSAPAEGNRSASVCFRDAAGNTSIVSDSIYVDSFDPSATLRVEDDGDAFIRTTTINLFIVNPTSDVVSVAFANGSITCATATFSPFTGSFAFTVPTGETSKTIAGCVKDQAGRTGTMSATVTLDSTPPAATITLAGGSGFTSTPTVAATVTGEGLSGAQFAAGAGVLDCENVTYAAFTGTASPNITFTGGDGTKTASACVKDAAGNTTLATATIVLDQVAPDALLLSCVTCNRDATNAFVTNTRNHTLSVDAIDDTSSVETVRVTLTDPNAVQSTTDVAFAPNLPIILADVNGSHTVAVRFIDSAGRLSSTLQFTVTLDRTAPSGTLVLTGIPSGTLTRTLSITARVSGASADAASMATTNDSSFSGAVFVPFSTGNFTHTLLAGDGAKQVFLRLRDFAGNESANIPAGITLDTTPPSAPTILLGAGADVTNQLSVSVALGAAGSATEVAISQDGVFDTEAFVSPIVSPQTIAFANSADGIKTFFAIFRDAAGNETAAVNDSILLDRTAPSGVSFTINNGLLFTRSVSVTLGLTATGANNMRIGIDAAASGAPLQAFAGTANILLGAVEGNHTVNVRFEDTAGNFTDATPRTIVLDTIAPSGPRISSSSIRTAANRATGEGALSSTFDIVVGTRGTDTNSPLQHKRIGGDAASPTNFTPPGGSAPFSLTYTLANEGAFNLGVFCTDPALNDSSIDSVAIIRDNTATNAPNNLLLFPRDGEIAMNWERPTTVGSALADDLGGYLVYYGTNPPGSAASEYDGNFADQGQSPIDVGLNTSFVLTGLTNNSSVTVAIQAYDTTFDKGGGSGVAPNLSSLSTAQTATPNPVTPRLIGTITAATGGTIFPAMAARQNRLYTNFSGQGFKIFDIANPAQPVTLFSGSANAFPEQFDATVFGEFVYLSGGSGQPGVRAVNVGQGTSVSSTLMFNAADRNFVGFVPTGRFAYGVALDDLVSGDATLIKAEGSANLNVGTFAQVSTLAIADRLPSCVDASTKKIAVGSFASSSTHIGTLRIFDTDPTATTAPTLFTTVNFQNSAVRDVQIVGRKAYVALQTNTAGGANGLAIVDLFTGSVNGQVSGFDCTSIAVAGRHAYCNDDSNGSSVDSVVVIDVGDPTNPLFAGRVSGGKLHGMAIAQDVIASQDGTGSVNLYEIVRPNNLLRRGSVAGNYTGVAMRGPLVYAVGNYETTGFRIFDISNPNDPAPRDFINGATLGSCSSSSCGTARIALEGNHAIVTSSNASVNDVLVIDVSDPFNAVIENSGGSGSAGGGHRGVAIRGNAIFTIDTSQNVQAWRAFRVAADATGPPIVERLVSLGPDTTAFGPALEDGKLFVQGQFGSFTAIDAVFADGTSGTMATVGSLASGAGGNGLVVGGGTAFCARNDNGTPPSGMRVVDVTNPAAPVASIPAGTIQYRPEALMLFSQFLIAGHTTSLNDGVHGVRIWDVSDPSDFQTVNENNSFDDPLGIAVDGTLMAVATDEGGLQVLELSR